MAEFEFNRRTAEVFSKFQVAQDRLSHRQKAVFGHDKSTLRLDFSSNDRELAIRIKVNGTSVKHN